MAIELFDIIVVFTTVIFIGFAASYLPAKILTKRYFNTLTREV